MKKLSLIIVGLWLALASPALAAVALVSGQTISGNGGFGATTDVLVLPNNPTTNNLVVCTVQSLGHTTMSVADANSNNYTATTSTPLTGAGGFFGIFYFVATGTASKTITLTDTGNSSGFINGWCAEFSGTATASVFERDGTAVFGGPGTTINTPSITTTNNGDLLVAIGNSFGTMSSANSPWTAIGSIGNTASNLSEYFVQTTAGAQAVGFTTSTSSAWDAMSAAFKASAGGGSGGGRQPVFVFGLGP